MEFTTAPPAMKCPQCGQEVYPEVVLLPETQMNYAKAICPECKKWLDWIGKPKNQGSRHKGKFTPENLGIAYCEICLRPASMLGSREILEVHHKMPVELGGEDVETNVLVLCTYCHKEIHLKHKHLYKHFRPKDLNEAIHVKKPPLPIEPIKPLNPKQIAVSIPMVNGIDFQVTHIMVQEWKKSFPSVDIPQALENMRQWCLSNPRRRKTSRGVRQFVSGWLMREQDKGPRKTIEPQIYDPRPKMFPR